VIDPQTPDLVIEYWPRERLVPYIGNPRKNDAAVDRMVDVIKEFGFAVPLLGRSATGELIDGHLRLKAGDRLGMTRYPVIACDRWTEAQVTAFRLLVNRSVTWATWDPDLLRVEFAKLKELSFDLTLTGFESREIDGFTIAPASGEDDVPPAATVVTSRRGDIWVCGSNRVACSDSTNPAEVGVLLGGAAPGIMVTDPPYGVEYDSDWRLARGINKKHQTLADGKVANDSRADWREAWKLFPGDVAYIWHSGLHSAQVVASLEASGFKLRAQIIWAKKSIVIGRGHYHWQHEPCWYAVRSRANWHGDRKQSTVWQIENMHVSQGNVDDGKTVHSTQKPVECMRRPILNHTTAGALVYDPFLGSGSTLIAAQLTGRACIGADIEPRYVDLTVDRWQRISGRAAVLEGDERPFDEIRNARAIEQQPAAVEAA
jgi:DNA modification methylase